VAAVERDEIQIHIDQQIGSGRALLNFHDLALIGVPQHDVVVFVFGVVIVERVFGPVRVENFGAQHLFDFPTVHVPMQTHGDHQMHVRHAAGGEAFEQHIDNGLAVIGRAHDRQRERNVVDGDGDFHAGLRCARNGSNSMGWSIARSTSRAHPQCPAAAGAETARACRQELSRKRSARHSAEKDCRRLFR